MKYSELKKLNKNDRNKKLKDLKMELVKEGVSKQGGNKSAKIRKIIAQIETLNTTENKSSGVGKK